MTTITIGTTVEPNRGTSRSVRAWLVSQMSVATRTALSVLAFGRRTLTSDHAVESGLDHMMRTNAFPRL